MYFGMAVAGNVIATSLIMTLAGKIAWRVAEIELPFNKCYVVIGVLLAAFVFPKLLEMFSQMSQKVFHMSESEVVKNAIDYYFLMVIAVVCFGTQIGLTTFYFNLPYGVYRRLYLIACLAAAFKVILALTDDGAKDSRSNVDDTGNKQSTTEIMGRKLKENKLILLSIPVALVFYLAFPSEHYLYQQFLAPLIIGCVGVRIRKIFIAAFVPSTLVIVVMVLAALGGGINSMAYIIRDMRSCWGHVYPTDFGTAVLFIVLFMWILFRDIKDEVFLIPAGISYLLSKCVTRSFTSTYLSILFIVFLIIRIAARDFLKSKNDKNWIIKLSNFIMLSAFPAFGMIMLFLVYAYIKQKGWAFTIDTLMHGRLVYPAQMYAKHGLHPFGTFFDMVGAGGSTVSNYGQYNFLDSTYPQIFIRYGWLTYIVANALWVFTTLRAIKTGNRRLALAMTVMAADFIMEHHWYELCYNPFILIAFSDFTYDKIEKWKPLREFKEKWSEKKYAISFSAVAIVQLALCILMLPMVFTRMRTLINGLGLYGGGRNGIKVFAGISCLLILAGNVIWTVSSIAADAATGRKANKRKLAAMGISLTVFLVIHIAGSAVVSKVTIANSDRIESEREILELAIANKNGNVFVDKLPEAYMNRISGFSNSYMNGHDYARYEDATILVDADWDSACMSGRGFLYLQISDKDALYTNDEGVIEALTEAGYEIKGYNSYKHTVSLEHMANLNDIELTDEGILLKGLEHRLIHGPYIELASGKFTAGFELKLKDRTGEKDRKICGIRIASYSGESIKGTADIVEGDFDEEGKLTYEMPFSGDGQGYEFLVFTDEGVNCIVSSISYSRTPDTDTHVKVDDEGRVIHEEYYNMDGTPKQMSEGHYGMEYEYDKNDQRTLLRYLGSDFKPVSTSTGYAEIHREYDIDKRLTRESYYGTESEPVNRPTGEHSVRKEYDFSGNVIQEAYYDTEDKPVIYDNAYFKIIRLFDDKNRCIREEYYGTDDELITRTAGNAALEREYDEEGNVIRQVFLGLDLKPVVIDSGYAEVQKEYNADKCVTCEKYFDDDGERILLNDKYFMIRRDYDEKKQCIGEKYYDTEENPINLSGGYAGYERSFDNKGNVVHMTYLGLDGKPVITDWGYSIWHRNYNDKKQVIREEYYAVSDAKIARPGGQFAVEHEYDEAGNCISDIYFGLDNERILVDGRFWKVVRTYNENKKNIHEEYFGTDEKLILLSEKYAMVDFTYDENGKLVKKTFKDAAGEVVEEQMVE